MIFLLEFFILFFLSRKLTQSISLLLFRITKNPEHAIRLFHTLFLPGVMIHELAHLLTSEVLFVKTHGLSLTLERHGDELTMGSVQIEKTDPVRRAIIGFAPVFVGFIFIFFTTFLFLSDKSPFSPVINYLIIFFVVFEVGNTMFSSRKDLDGTVELLIFFVLVFGVLYVLGFSFQPIIDFMNSHNVEELFLKAIKILLIPISIDLFIVLSSRFVTNRN